MDHLTATPSRSFSLSTLCATTFLYGGLSWGMEPSYSLPEMGPDDMLEKLIGTIPEDQHIGSYLESIEPSDVRYKIIHASFEKELMRKNIIILKEWKEETIFEMVNALGLRSPFLMPGLMQALKDNKNIRIMDVSGLSLTPIDEECIANILETNKRITLTRNQEEFYKAKNFVDHSENQEIKKDETSDLLRAMNILERLNLTIWMTTPLMTGAKTQGITSPFLLPGFVHALRQNKTIKVIDCRGYKLTTLESDFIDQILSFKKDIKVLKDSDPVTLSSENNINISLKSSSKKHNNSPSSPLNTSLSDEELGNSYRAHMSMFNSLECLNLKEITEAGPMRTLEAMGITSIFMLPDFVRALQDNTTIKTIDIRNYDLTKFDIEQLIQVLDVNKRITLIPDINLLEILTQGESTQKVTGRKYRRIESPSDFRVNNTLDDLKKAKEGINSIKRSNGHKSSTNTSSLSQSNFKESIGVPLKFISKTLGVSPTGDLQGDVNKILHEGALDIQEKCLLNNNKTLNYQGINVNEEFILDVLVRLIPIDTFVTHLIFNTCQIDDQGAIKLVEALKENKTIRHLDLRNNKIGPIGAAGFINLFGSSCIVDRKPCFNDTIEILQLEGNPIPPYMLTEISKGIEWSEFTKELDEDQQTEILIELIEKPQIRISENPEKLDA